MLRQERQTLVKGIACIFIIAFPTLWGCMPNAERDNPYDPKSDGYRDEGTLTGMITRRAQPSEGIEGVTVMLDPPKGSSSTDRNGFFAIDNIPTGSYGVKALKTGFSQDSATVQITAGLNKLDLCSSTVKNRNRCRPFVTVNSMKPLHHLFLHVYLGEKRIGVP